MAFSSLQSASNATVANSYYRGAFEFALKLAAQNQLDTKWLDDFSIDESYSRVNASQYERFLNAAAVQLKAPDFGLNYGLQIDISSFNLLGYLAMSSATLADASRIVNQYGVLVSEIGQLEIEYPEVTDDSIALIKIIWQPSEAHQNCSTQVTDGVLAGWINFGKKFLGRQSSIHCVYLSDRAIDASIYETAFDCKVVLGGQENYIEIEKQFFDLPLQQAEPLVHAAIQLKAEQEIKVIHDLSPTLTSLIRQHLPHLIFNNQANIEQLANQLNLTTRSLQRKLKREGLSFRQLLDDARRSLTLQLLEENEQPLIHISGIVGFNDQSSFNRAFKRWTGLTPKQFFTQNYSNNS